MQNWMQSKSLSAIEILRVETPLCYGPALVRVVSGTAGSGSLGSNTRSLPHFPAVRGAWLQIDAKVWVLLCHVMKGIRKDSCEWSGMKRVLPRDLKLGNHISDHLTRVIICNSSTWCVTTDE